MPGDVVLLEAGDRVPADLRLVEGAGCVIDEAVLTGESVPVDKGAACRAAGRCRSATGSRWPSRARWSPPAPGSGVVVATGGGTELGRIGALIGAVETLAPRRCCGRCTSFARQLTVATLAVAAGDLRRSRRWCGAIAVGTAFMAVVGLAVAAIPEGLPAVMTITLAIGVQRMAARNAIVRRLPAVETLGLGLGDLHRQDRHPDPQRDDWRASVVTAGGTIGVNGESATRRPAPSRLGGATLDPASRPGTRASWRLRPPLCNDAQLRRAGRQLARRRRSDGGGAARARGEGRARHPRRSRRVAATTTRSRSTHGTVHGDLHARPGRSPVAFVKGAPERLLAMCTAVATPEGTGPLDRDSWARQVEALAGQGQRVLALARRGAASRRRAASILAEVEHGLVLLGLVGLIDPPRAGGAWRPSPSAGRPGSRSR